MNLKNLYQNEYSFEETINENSFRIESFSHLSVKDTLGTSNNNDIIAKELYLITKPEVNESGNIQEDNLFKDKINQIACYNTNLGWIFYQPKIGDIAYIQSIGDFYFFNGSNWSIMTTSASGNSSSFNNDQTQQSSTTNNSEIIKIENPFYIGFKITSKELPDNPSWLKSDATLKDGTIYVSIYEKILNTYNNGNEKIININNKNYNGKELDGFVVLNQVDWKELYDKYNVCDYYGIDTKNTKFYLPYSQSVHGQLISKQEANGDNTIWFRLYADGWCEQGGRQIINTSMVNIDFKIPYKDMNYTIIATAHGTNQENAHVASRVLRINTNRALIGVSTASTSWTSKYICWNVMGYTDRTTAIISQEYDYYYVGAILQTNNNINIVKLLNKIFSLETRLQQLEEYRK